MPSDQPPDVEVDRRAGPGKIPPQVFEAMVANSQNLITEAQLLRVELERIKSDRRTFKVAVTAVVVLVAGLLLLGLWNWRTLGLVEGCTSPAGQCFREAAQRQADIIGDPPAPINNVIILAAACADREGVDTEAEIRACVLDGLASADTPGGQGPTSGP